MEDFDSMTKQELIYKYIELKAQLECALEYNKVLLERQKETNKLFDKCLDEAMQADGIILK